MARLARLPPREEERYRRLGGGPGIALGPFERPFWALVGAGAAEMIIEKDLNAEILAQRIGYYRLNTKALKEMTEKSKQFGRPEAAEIIVEDCYNIMDRKGVLRQEAQSL